MKHINPHFSLPHPSMSLQHLPPNFKPCLFACCFYNPLSPVSAAQHVHGCRAIHRNTGILPATTSSKQNNCPSLPLPNAINCQKF